MPQLDPTWYASQLFWLAITFTALYLLLAFVVLPPLQSILTTRRQTREDDLGLAVEVKTLAEHARQDYERTLHSARERSQLLLNEAMATQKAQAEARFKEVDQEIAKTLSEANSRISTQKKQLMDALTPAANELAEAIVEKLTSSKPKPDSVKQVVDQLLKQQSKS